MADNILPSNIELPASTEPQLPSTLALADEVSPDVLLMLKNRKELEK